MELPEAIILSTQRSGTHLLESFLKKHPLIEGLGEIFLRYTRTGKLDACVPGKVNLGIVMYNQVNILEACGGSLENCKLIHLLRDPKNVALSRLQVTADKERFGASYRAHMKKQQEHEPSFIFNNERSKPDLGGLDSLITKISNLQNDYCEQLKKIPHLEIRYEDFVSNNQTVSVLNPEISRQIFTYIGLPDGPVLTTDYVKTGISR